VGNAESRWQMKHLLITTIAAMLVVGCGEAQQSAPPAEAKPVEPVAEAPAQPPSPVESQPAEPVVEDTQPEPPTAKAPDISIHKAAATADLAGVQAALGRGADVNAGDDGRITPLQHATGNGHKEIAQLLIAKGADVNTKDSDGGTPLHLAAIGGYMEIAELLINNGADVNAKNFQSKSPLDFAIKYKQTDIADLLRKHGGKTGEELKAEGK